jgi:cytochrome c-type biogenesis protein
MMEITYIGAVMAGLLSFLSPFILPLVPFYLSYLVGVGMNQISDGAELDGRTRGRAVLAACCFAAGVITIFIGLGAAATTFGQLVSDYFDILRWVAAAIIIVMGLHFLGVIKVGLLYRQLRMEAGDTSNVSLIGVGPVLAAILFIAAGAETSADGATLLFAYGFGMTFPFILAAFFVAPFMRWMSRFRPYLAKIEKVMGLMLIVFGLLIATNSMNVIAQWMLSVSPIFDGIG